PAGPHAELGRDRQDVTRRGARGRDAVAREADVGAVAAGEDRLHLFRLAERQHPIDQRLGLFLYPDHLECSPSTPSFTTPQFPTNFQLPTPKLHLGWVF